MPRVYNRHKYKNIPADAILIDRTTKWGNKFRIGQYHNGRRMTRKDVIEAHRDWLLNSEEGRRLLADIGELTGHSVICWCAPLPCHGDTYIELANK